MFMFQNVEFAVEFCADFCTSFLGEMYSNFGKICECHSIERHLLNCIRMLAIFWIFFILEINIW